MSVPPDGEGSESPSGKGLPDLPGMVAFLTMGTTIAACEAVGVVLGLWADRAWGAAPLWLLIGIALGTVAAVVSVLQLVRRFL
ncbi:MAG: AtpZ/AtpI family protein [Acidimicrobiales bacterium]